MNILQAIILGLIQGLTEFIPVSSTAHLTICGHIFGIINDNQRWTSFLAIIQLGTLVAIIIYFYKDILKITSAFFIENFSKNRKKFKQQTIDARLGTFIIIGSVPIVLIALIFEDLIEGEGTKNLLVISLSLITIAIALFIAEKFKKMTKGIHDVGLKEALIIGFAQCLALIPGASRSGSTIMASMLLGMKREASARFSFLLSIPAIFGSGIYSLFKSLKFLSTDDILILILGVVISGIVGYLSIAFLLNYLKTKTTMLFIIYRIILGLIIFTFYLFNIL